jgi:hypothetical protein
LAGGAVLEHGGRAGEPLGGEGGELGHEDEPLGAGEGRLGGVGAHEVDVLAVDGALVQLHGDEPDRSRPALGCELELEDVADHGAGLLGRSGF